MNTVFCVEDDANIRELISYTLTSAGFEVESFENGNAFFKRLSVQTPDVVLLDIMLPDMDGMEILKKLRSDESKNNVCVIMLTAKSERMDKIRGLDTGADDYMTKPFDVLELISRVKAILRRTQRKSEETHELCFDQIRLDHKKRVVYVSDTEISLTYKEYELLHMLMAAKGDVVTRETIISKIWGTDFEGESRTLDVHIRTLRQKLGEAGNHIDTVRNVGYKIG
ncbi:MAG: response regulator transcription factor [Clostridia bacterium]|nr:response regulator transcription factor [Clostridia bacterium]